ncbi:MAG: efflux RND transporter periplasmic adaptor subunit [Gammaproteobacteria bacterium]
MKKLIQTQWIVWTVIALIGLVVVWGGYSWYQKKRLEIEQSLVRPIPVMTAPVEQRDMPILVQAFGDLRAFDIAQLSAQSSGNIVEIHFNGGEKVEKDAVLAVIDNATEEANLQKAQAQQALSQIEYNRQANLVQRGAQPQQALDQAKAELAVKNADILAAQDALDKSFIKAPFTGRLGARLMSLGQYVSPGQNLVEIVNTDTLKVQFSVPEQYLSKLNVGQEVELSTSAYPDLKFAGKVDYVSPSIDPVTRNISVEGLVDNQQDFLSPGLSTQLSLILGHDQNALVVPEESLVYSLEGPSLFLAEDAPEFQLDERVKEQILLQQSAQRGVPVDQLPPLSLKKVNKVRVETSTFLNGSVQVTTGVKAGDLVITQGQQKLREGVIVMVVDPAARMAEVAAKEKANSEKQAK